MNLSEKRIKHRIERCKKRIEKLEHLHNGNTQDYTYHDGFTLGYEKGVLAVLEEILDEVTEQCH